MPIAFVIDEEHQVVLATITGPTTLDEAIGYERALESHPAYRPSLDRLVDLRALRLADVPRFDVVHAIAEQIRRSGTPQTSSKRAYVFEKADAVYGVGRQLEALTHRADGVLVRVFTVMADARLWLGLPPEH